MSSNQNTDSKEKKRLPSPRASVSNNITAGSSSISFKPAFPRGRPNQKGSPSSPRGFETVGQNPSDLEEEFEDEDDEVESRKSELPLTKEVLFAFVRASPILLSILFIFVVIFAAVLLSERSLLSHPHKAKTSTPATSSPDSSSIFLVLVTVPIDDKSFNIEEFTRSLLEKKLVACVTMCSDVTSMYWWKEKIESSQERHLILKTTGQHLAELEREIRLKHPYEIPEIVHLRIDGGGADYIQWIQSSVASVVKGA